MPHPCHEKAEGISCHHFCVHICILYAYLEFVLVIIRATMLLHIVLINVNDSLSRTHYPLLSTGSTQEDMTEKMLTETLRIKSNKQNKQN